MNFKNISVTSALLCVFTFGCSQGPGPARTADQMVRPLADDVVIVEYKGGKITAGDVKDRVDAQVKQFSDEMIEAYKKGAEQMLVMKLMEQEAKKQGVANPQELLGKVAQDIQIDDAAVQKFIKDNKLDKGIQDPKTGKMRKVSNDEVRGFLTEQEMQSKQQSFFSGLRAQAEAKFKLEKPAVKVEATGKEPTTGNKDAKVVIYEFSDFQCPFCARGHAVIKQVMTEYGDKVKLVFRHFPLSFHPEAEPSAIAAMCAFKQAPAKFWEYHDLMFENQSELNEASRTKWAKQIGLNEGDFAKCVSSKEPKSLIDADMKAAEALGVNSTPTFFINGKKVAGALPFAQFKSMIDEELAAH
ncbi:MAG: DsbA family protein [Bdellovibrionota bacterium]